MVVVEKSGTPVRRSLFIKFGEKKIYSIALIISRLIFAICQISVSMDTWNHFKKLSRIPQEGNYDMSLKPLTEYKGDLSWVPSITKKVHMHETYGSNNLFNLYLIRLSHYFHTRISNFLIFFSAIMFLLLILLSVLDLVLMFQKKWIKIRFRTPSLFIRAMLYSCLFGLVFTQFIFIMYYRRSLCSMETLYRELFVTQGEYKVRLEFLQEGTCKMSQRFLGTYIMSFMTLLPDAFLIVVAIIPALRIHSVVNGMKYFGSIFFLITAFVVMDFRQYIRIGTTPYILDYGVTQFNERTGTTGRTSEVIKLFHTQNSFKMFNVKDSITLQVGRALRDYSKDRSRALEPRYQIDAQVAQTETSISHFNFAKQIFAQWDHSSRFYMYFAFYASFISLVDALSGTVMVIKRHRFLIPLIAILNFIYFFTHIVHCIMVQFPMIQSRFICRIKMYTADEAGFSFETLALSDLMCKIRDVYISSFAMLVILVTLAFTNVVNLYFLRKRK